MRLNWSPIPEDSVIWLEKPFSKQEINEVVFEISKSPHPNVFTMAVFQDCWRVFKMDLVVVFK